HGPYSPKLGEELVADQTAEYVDRGALGTDRLVPDDPRGDLVMPHPPYRNALVPLDHRLGQSVQVRVRAALVELDQVDAALGNQCVEGRPGPPAGPLHCAPPGRLETGAVTEHGPDRLEGPRTQMSQHLQLAGDELDA